MNKDCTPWQGESCSLLLAGSCLVSALLISCPIGNAAATTGTEQPGCWLGADSWGSVLLYGDGFAHHHIPQLPHDPQGWRRLRCHVCVWGTAGASSEGLLVLVAFKCLVLI